MLVEAVCSALVTDSKSGPPGSAVGRLGDCCRALVTEDESGGSSDALSSSLAEESSSQGGEGEMEADGRWSCFSSSEVAG